MVRPAVAQIRKPLASWSDIAQIGDSVFFAATDPTGGDELWKTDGTPDGTVRVADIVPVDYVADAILGLDDAPAAGTTYHLTAGDRAVGLEQLVELTCRATGHEPPPVVPRADFSDHIGDSSAARVLLAHLDDYLPYMDVRARFDGSAAHAHLAPKGIEVPPFADYIEALLSFATTARWGRRPVTRVAARAEHALAA